MHTLINVASGRIHVSGANKLAKKQAPFIRPYMQYLSHEYYLHAALASEREAHDLLFHFCGERLLHMGKISLPSTRPLTSN